MKMEPILPASACFSVPQQLWAPTNLKMSLFSCFFFNANLVFLMLHHLQTTNERSTGGNPTPPTWFHISKREMWCVQFSPRVGRFTPSRPLKTWVMLRPSGCSVFLSSSETRIFSAPCVHHFILININLMRWEFRNSPIYDLPPCHCYLEIDFLQAYGRFSNLWYTRRISDRCLFILFFFFGKWELRPLKPVKKIAALFFSLNEIFVFRQR